MKHSPSDIKIPLLVIRIIFDIFGGFVKLSILLICPPEMIPFPIIKKLNGNILWLNQIYNSNNFIGLMI